jgi:hypothetical protein
MLMLGSEEAAVALALKFEAFHQSRLPRPCFSY